MKKLIFKLLFIVVVLIALIAAPGVMAPPTTPAI